MTVESNNTKTSITKSQMRLLSDDKIILLIKNAWDIQEQEPIEVIGRLNANYSSEYKTYFYRLTQSSSLQGVSIEYPISDINPARKIQATGFYIPSKIDNAIKEIAKAGKHPWVKCQLEMSPEIEREKHDLPCELQVVNNSVTLLEELDIQIYQNQSSMPLVEKWLIQYIEEKNKKYFQNINIELEQEIEQLQSKKQSEVQNYEDLVVKTGKLTENITSLNRQIKSQNDEIILLENELLSIRELILKEDQIMGIKLEKFRSFIREKAEKLLQLELLDIEEYNEIMMLKEGKEEETESLHFMTDLNGDFSSAVKHIQAYLFNKDIIYPRYVLEDFFALIKTNDLIILAGESGSGKTNLVKSFAEAVNGKSVIIPVKPNWTSSEDLLGYYNPLEKKYLATPFLEAILEASHNLDTPYFICLDEMNLARVEYYFADFLSLLEERNSLPEIKLYSEDESAHVLSEFKHVISLIDAAKEKYQKNHLVNFMELLQDQEVNRELKNVFGLNEKDSLIKYHSDLRRMLHGIINTPSSITFPPNVRIIGTVNIDETTHYLAPKILDRAHVMKFDSPLLYDWESISAEIETSFDDSLPLNVGVDDLGVRSPYPSFDKDGDFEKIVMNLNRTFFNKIGIEVGLRTIRQALNYKDVFNQVIGDLDLDLVLNNFVLHKILPKITFDGNTKIEGKEKIDLLKEMLESLNETCENVGNKGRKSCIELESMILKAKENDGIVNYWA